MTNPSDIAVELDRTSFFQIGRALQRGFGKSKLGTVSSTVQDGVLTIESGWGGGRIPCTPGHAVAATVSAKSFCSLVTTRYREEQPAGSMKIEFWPGFKEVGIDLIGVKAQFDPC